jgi:hypothetical protein
MVAKSKTDIDEPRWLIPQIENREPKRAMLRRESVDPRCRKSNTDRLEPMRATP